jgi:8-amino-7-oxononanoate synthase
VAAELASLQGCEAATLLPSTLHLFSDLFTVLALGNVLICVEARTYAIARRGARQGASAETPVYTFPAGDTAAFERLVGHPIYRGRRPIIVCDAFWPGSDRQPPLARYATFAAQHHGLLVLDDTHALGVLGHGANTGAPLGWGGGGSLRHRSLRGAHVVGGASLAKGFGVPIAVLSGSRATVSRIEAGSEIRVHASPPSVAVIQAATRALALNRQCGDALRLRLTRRVQQFRRRLARLGLKASGGAFPVQSLAGQRRIDVASLHAGLLERGVRTVLHEECGIVKLSFIITAVQNPTCIDRAADVLAQTIRALTRDGNLHVPLVEVT